VPRVTSAVLGAHSESLINFRGDLMRDLLRHGPVYAAAAGSALVTASALRAMGVTYTGLPLQRTGYNPLFDLYAIGSLFRWLRQTRPDCLVAYTVKPVVYGMLVASWLGIPRRVAMITGLGYPFSDGVGLRLRLTKMVVSFLYKIALGRAHCVIFQNPDDRALCIRLRLVRSGKTLLTAGSGVNVQRFSLVPLPAGPITFLLIARLVRDKGILEFVRAAAQVRHSFPQVRCRIVGPIDTNPAAISRAEVDAWVADGLVEWGGAVRDVRPEIAACHVYVLPSYYREGVPRTVLEAMAMGRPIITTDAPGCRETVVHGVNGLLVQPRSSESLAGAMRYVLEHQESLARMGLASRSRAEEHFDVRRVNARTLAAMGMRPFGVCGRKGRTVLL
jgi:glycosyltransferase involved in cell wall biosynthesis